MLATNVGRHGDDEFAFSAARITRSVRESIKRFGVGYIDLMQFRDIEFVSLEQVAGEAIPLSALLYVARQVPVDTVMSYCQYTVQDRRLGARAAEFAATGVALINASPLAMGALTDQGAPPWHPAPVLVLNRCAKAAARCRERESSLARLALQYSVMTSPCVTTVVGSASPAR